MSNISNIRIRNVTDRLQSTDIFAVYRNKTWIPVKGLRFDDLIFGDPTVFDGDFQINGDLILPSLTEDKLITVDSSGNIVSTILDKDNPIPEPTSISFNDNVSQVVTIGDKTVEEALKVYYSLDVNGKFESGDIRITHDGTTVCGDVETTGTSPFISTIDFTFTFVGNDIRMNLVATGTGDPATFKYSVIRKIEI